LGFDDNFLMHFAFILASLILLHKDMSLGLSFVKNKITECFENFDCLLDATIGRANRFLVFDMSMIFS